MSDNKISYTNRDIVAIRSEIVNRVKELTDKWRDFNESDVGMTYIEFLAGIADMLNFYLDREALEHSIYTARQDKNIRSIMRSMNYRIPLMCAARWGVNVTYEDNLSVGITIPRYTAMRSTKGKNYCTSEDVTMVAGRRSYNIPLIQGEPAGSRVTVGKLKENRRYYTKCTDVADKSVHISQEGKVWEEVEDALLCYEGGYYFSVHKDSSDEVYLLFSPDWRERLGDNSLEEVSIEYVKTEGTKGVVHGDSINKMEFLGTAGIVVRNLGEPFGAVDDIDLEKTKRIAQDNMRVMNRFVTIEDYECRVRKEPYISDCAVYDWKSSYVDRPFNIDVYAVTTDGKDLSELMSEYTEDDNIISLRDGMIEELRSKGVSYNTVTLKKVDFVEKDITVKIRVRGQKPARDDVKLSVTSRIEEYFSVSNLRFGRRMSLSMLVSEIYGVSSLIDRVNVVEPSEDVEVSGTQFLKIGNIDVLVIGDDVDE